MLVVRRTLEKPLRLLPRCRAQPQHGGAGSERTHGAFTTLEKRLHSETSTDRVFTAQISLKNRLAGSILSSQCYREAFFNNSSHACPSCCLSCPMATPESCPQQDNSWRARPDVHQLAPMSSLVKPADQTSISTSSHVLGTNPRRLEALAISEATVLRI